MNILALWQKQIEQVTQRDTRSVLLLSYRRLLQLGVNYFYCLATIIIVAVLLSVSKIPFSQYSVSFFVIFLSQIVALLLRPSIYKKDANYLVRICKNNYVYLFFLPGFLLIMPIITLPFCVVIIVFFQLIAADGQIRKISLLRTIRAALLLFWYNLPAVGLCVMAITGMVWIISLCLNMHVVIDIFLFSSFYLVLVLFVAFLVVVYTASVYEHVEELF